MHRRWENSNSFMSGFTISAEISFGIPKIGLGGKLTASASYERRSTFQFGKEESYTIGGK